jgi:LacI family transcriptional regulator
MHCEIFRGHAAFLHLGKPVAEYVLDDPFKPHFRSLRTPAGHETTLVSPGDHRHHKGLMYAIRAADLNFWEETPGRGCGVQAGRAITPTAEGDGFVQDLLWRGEAGDLETYRERRTVRARHAEAERAFVYTWRIRRESLRDHRLIKSEWSAKLPDGRVINYHGLGIRLPWMWRFPGPRFGAVEVDGVATAPEAAIGTAAAAVGFWGLIDGRWERTVAAVTFRQPAGQGFTWYVKKADFPFLSVGPSNAAELDIPKGHVAEESYEVWVQDRPA